MEKPIIAVIQHKIIVTKTLDELLTYFHRFLRIAKTKGSQLALFPEYSGLAVGIPMFPGWRNALLKEAAAPKRGILPKLKSMLAGGAANVMRADLKKALLMTLQEMPESLYDVYISVFADLAQQYDMTIVAGSLYFYDVETASIRHASFVFGPDGSLLGRHDQVATDAVTLDAVQLGPGWTPIDTPVGRIGLLFGYEVLYPEPARALAYQGAEMLLTLAATKRPATYHKIRQAALARCQENQLYGAAAFLVGEDPFATPDAPPFLGRSAIFAPLEFTPRFTGVMTELGSVQAEGVITAEWDYPALRELWETSDTPIRKRMPLEQVGLLAQVYGRALPLASSSEPLPAPTDEAARTALLQVEEAEPVEETRIAAPEEDIPIIAPILPTEPPIIALDAPETPSDEDGEGDVLLDRSGEPEPSPEQKETPEPELKTPDAGDATEDDLV
ncbi:MAG TPA: hypothetical protein EYP25_08690 [Anaerolineae bacterium]|nr:hypothetical protein [Anaerolineae bacterium]